MTNFNKDLKEKLAEMVIKIKRLQWRYNISIGHELDQAVDELADLFLKLTNHPGFEPADSTDVISHLYGIQLQDIWGPLESALYTGTA